MKRRQPHPVALLPEEWSEVLALRGERSFRARQIFKWIHGRGVLEPAAMTDLSLPLRRWLEEQRFASPGRVVHMHRAADGTRKLLVEMTDGARVECVLIPMTSDRDADAAAADDDELEESSRQRVTLCVSTQYGCAMACTFCASGRAGLGRGLEAQEIVIQVLLARQYLEAGEALQNLVFMGMGEPLHHYDETARALRLLTHEQGADMSSRRITVSTVGLIPGIRRLGHDFSGKIGLAISLHAPDDETRNRLVPMNRRYPIDELMQALREYPLPRRRRITIEYTLIDGINDSDAHARALVGLLRGIPVKVNLIPLNQVPGVPFAAPSEGRLRAFQSQVGAAGLSCFVRTRRGDDVAAACGQLAIHGQPSVRLRPSKLGRDSES
jgi:23S rRNA (adenine2503-C2)-methyltransferase